MTIRKNVPLATLAAASLLLASCSAPSDEEVAALDDAATSTAHDHDHDHDGHDHEHEGHDHDGFAAGEGEVEVAELPTRVVFTYNGGVHTFDVKAEKLLEDEDIDGFLRLNDAGDGRHAFVTQGDKFLTFDSGLIEKAHGDHSHYYTAAPQLTGESVSAPHAGHVVAHDGYTALFSDGDGVARIYETEAIGSAAKPVATFDTGAAHHGVAVPLEDGSVVITKGTEDKRNTIQHLDADGKVLAETTQCPGVHGEAAAGNGKLFFGCEDGPVVFDGKDFQKVDVSSYAGAGGYQRSGNSAGSEESSVILADNKTEKDADFERPESVALIDTDDYSARTVDLGASYWFRSLARGPLGEALVLTTDGNLNIIDPDTGKVTEKIQAIGEWKEKEEWQQPGPILKAADGYAYITDANAQELVIVDLYQGKVTKRVDLDFAPVEMAVL